MKKEVRAYTPDQVINDDTVRAREKAFDKDAQRKADAAIILYRDPEAKTLEEAFVEPGWMIDQKYLDFENFGDLVFIRVGRVNDGTRRILVADEGVVFPMQESTWEKLRYENFKDQDEFGTKID